jgi:peptidoglycan/xylan/chitin deacetylase (PgdA/CDA1 family)
MTTPSPSPIPVLMYHQIDQAPPRNTPMRGLTVTPAAFARQMATFRLLGYRGLSMPALLPYLRGEKQGKVIGITFDDGYLNTLEHALPVLVRNGFCATCYAVSAAPGHVNAWDTPKGLPEKPLMQPSHWREWVKAGMDIGGHTRSHAALSTLSPQACIEEIKGGREDLQAHTGHPVAHFCYPYGDHNNDIREHVICAGYTSATTVLPGRVRLNDDPYTLPRVMVARTHHLLYILSRALWGYEDPR